LFRVMFIAFGLYCSCIWLHSVLFAILLLWQHEGTTLATQLILYLWNDQFTFILSR